MVLFAASATAAVGCGQEDVCAGVSGTCVALTVESSTVTAVDSLHIVAVGAIAGTQDTAGPRKSLPVHVALKLPSTASGAWHLTVEGLLAGVDVGSGPADVNVVAGHHSSAICTITGSGVDAGRVDGATDLGGDGGGPVADMLPVVCDPHGVNSPACVWRWQTPLPVGEAIVSVHSFADNDTFALTGSGTILHRDDTGWSILPARPKAATGMFYARKMEGGTGSSTDLFIVGYNTPPAGGSTIDEVFHSADKGVSWTEETLPTTATTGNNSFPGIAIGPGGNVVLAGGFSHILTRNQSNGTWADYQTDSTCAPPSMGCSTNYSTITSSLLANVATYGVNSISRANVGTNAWTLKIVGPNSNIVSALCSNSDGSSNFRYWGVGYSGTIITSTDSTTWSLETSNTAALLYGCTTINNQSAWAFGSSGTIIATTNGGVAGTGTWTGQSSGTSNQLLSGSHSPGTALTIVGEAGTILRSMNGGSSYTNEQTGPSGGWVAIFGITPTNVFAAGNGGSIVHTSDGSSWTAIGTTGTTANLTAVWASSATDVYAVGASGTLVHSTNGTSFTKYNNPASGGIPATASLMDVSGLGANNVFVAADTGLYRSTDGGTSFVPVTISGFTGTQVSALFAMGGGLWVGGSNGQIDYTTDGVSFASHTLTGVGASIPITRIRGRLPSELYATSSSGGWLAHSTDGGTTWSNSTVMSLGDGAFDLAVTPSGILYATVGQLLVSQDAGMTFGPVATAPVPDAHVALYAPSDSEIFATDSGGIVHFGD